MTIEGYEGERMLLSYDVSGSARSVAAQVAQIVFGRVRVSEAKSRIRYLEKGFLPRPPPGGCGGTRGPPPPARRTGRRRPRRHHARDPRGVPPPAPSAGLTC